MNKAHVFKTMKKIRLQAEISRNMEKARRGSYFFARVNIDAHSFALALKSVF